METSPPPTHSLRVIAVSANYPKPSSVGISVGLIRDSWEFCIGVSHPSSAYCTTPKAAIFQNKKSLDKYEA